MRFSVTQGVVIMVAAVVLLVLGFTQHKPSRVPVPEAPTQVGVPASGFEGVDEKEVIAPTEDSETIDISDWVEYRNEELGFAIQHPEDWERVSLSNDDVLFALQSRDRANALERARQIWDEAEKSGMSLGEAGYYQVHPSYAYELKVSFFESFSDFIERGTNDRGEYQDIEDYFANSVADKGAGEIELGGMTANEIEFCCGEGQEYGVVLENEGIYVFNFNLRSKESVEDIERQVLSTFEFIE